MEIHSVQDYITLLEKLKEMNIDESQLNDLKYIFEAEDSDIYDVLAHLSFNLDIKSRSERVIAVENSSYIEKYHTEKAKEFIEDGNKVKVVLTMKGRELGRREDSKKSLLTFIVEMDEVAVPESLPRDEGNKCTIILKKK